MINVLPFVAVVAFACAVAVFLGAAPARACSRLRACVHLGLYGNPGSEDKVQQALEQQRKLQEQWLTAEHSAQMK